MKSMEIKHLGLISKDFSPLCTLETLSETIEKYGVAVLPNVLPESECDEFREKIFEYLGNHVGAKTAQDVMKLKRIGEGKGIIRHYGLPLIKPVLDLKTDERVIEPYRRLWPEENGELTTSFDAIHIGVPPELTNERIFFKGTNFHSDQSSDKEGKWCIQGFINLEATETGDGCLSVIRESHRYFTEFWRHFNIDTHGRNWYVLDQSVHTKWFIEEKGCEWNTIMAPKGAMVFWDSRTIHFGTPPREGRPNPTRWRLLHYVCYTPARWQTAQDSKLKRTAYVENRCTSHWPYNVALFDKLAGDNTKNDLRYLTQRHRKYLGI